MPVILYNVSNEHHNAIKERAAINNASLHDTLGDTINRALESYLNPAAPVAERSKSPAVSSMPDYIVSMLVYACEMEGEWTFRNLVDKIEYTDLPANAGSLFAKAVNESPEMGIRRVETPKGQPVKYTFNPAFVGLAE